MRSPDASVTPHARSAVAEHAVHLGGAYRHAATLARLRQRYGERVRFQLLLDGVGRTERVLGEPRAERAHLRLVEPLNVDADLALPAHLRLQVAGLLLVQRRTEDGDVGEEVVDAGLGNERPGDLRVHADGVEQEARVLDGVAVSADRAQLARRAAGRAAGDRVALDDDGAYAVVGCEEVRGGATHDSTAHDNDVGGPVRGHGEVTASPW